eukprot:TRINITY_DN5033_c0_g1_i2.p1 TRINITY_DN5033_c0_g1~~TRINITY_DN5033_c0_g1_i2.p1  ORF type:complete len:133 (+),score=36.20 TRINITY_DN5033_c0_g1_i2:26-424(+)
MDQQQAGYQEINNRWNVMKQNYSQLIQKISELENDRDEHDLVIKTITPMDGQRTCWRLIGGVLVERTVQEVVPAVSQKREKIDEAINTLKSDLDTLENAMQEFAAKHKLYNQNEGETTTTTTNDKNATSVLV